MKRLLVLVLCACGSRPVASPPTPTSPEGPRFGAGPPLLTPGERMVYRVQLQGVELAAMTLGAGGRVDLGGRPAVVVQGHAKSVGLANLVAAIDDTFTSWIDVETGKSLRFTVDEYETNSKTNVEHTIAELGAIANRTLPITFALNDATPAAEPQTLKADEAWDYNAFLIALRAWEAPPGTKASAEVLRSRWLWHIDVTVGAKESLVTELGELPALRFDAHTYKLDRQGGKVADSEERDFSVWISDDDGRVPLKTVAKTDYGNVAMEIVTYEPGSGARLRP